MQRNFWIFGIGLFKNQNGLIKSLCSPTVSCNNKKYVTESFKKDDETPKILKTIQKLLSCDIAAAKKIYIELPSIRNADSLLKIENNVKVLLAHKVSLSSIIDNPLTLILPTGN